MNLNKIWTRKTALGKVRIIWATAADQPALEKVAYIGKNELDENRVLMVLNDMDKVIGFRHWTEVETKTLKKVYSSFTQIEKEYRGNKIHIALFLLFIMKTADCYKWETLKEADEDEKDEVYPAIKELIDELKFRFELDKEGNYVVFKLDDRRDNIEIREIAEKLLKKHGWTGKELVT